MEAGGALDQYEIEGPDRAELLQDLAEFQLAAVSACPALPCPALPCPAHQFCSEIMEKFKHQLWCHMHQYLPVYAQPVTFNGKQKYL